jgi:very-short-patch-repair endonuclease
MRAAKLPAAPSELEETFALHLKAEQLPEGEREYRFAAPLRSWAFDFAWPQAHLAVELEGWGRHQRRQGFEDDCVKYNTAAALGWVVLRFTAAMVRDGRAIAAVARYLRREPWTL